MVKLDSFFIIKIIFNFIIIQFANDFFDKNVVERLSIQNMEQVCT